MSMKSKSRKADKPVALADAALQPAIVLVRPRLPENVGMTARAMLNCGLSDLRLVAPAFSFPDQKAFDASSGADQVLRECRVFDDVGAALFDAQSVYASSARRHDLNLPVCTPAEAARDIVASAGKTAILFGAERCGLENHEAAHAQKILTIPLQDKFNSLNLAQAVLLTGHAVFLEMERAGKSNASTVRGEREVEAAPRAELDEFLKRLQPLLDQSGFLHPPEKRDTMWDNVRVLFGRGGLTSQEIKTLHGIITALSKK